MVVNVGLPTLWVATNKNTGSTPIQPFHDGIIPLSICHLRHVEARNDSCGRKFRWKNDRPDALQELSVYAGGITRTADGPAVPSIPSCI
jgi:hypothetical protein